MAASAWPTPLEKIRWAEAFKHKNKVVSDDRGRKFSCEYDRREGFVLVKPMFGAFAPMGYLPLDFGSELEFQEQIDPIYSSAIVEFLASEHAGVNVKEFWPNKFGRTTGATLDRKFRKVNSPDVDVLLIKGQVFLAKVRQENDEQS
ncbi:MAG TPA: hypothetical protein VGE97_07330 [Nitrososphaera sp.]